MSSKLIRIYIVDDEPMAISYLKYLLEETGCDYEVVGSATYSVQALTQIKELQPNIIFTDISMPVMDGLELSKRILSEYQTRIYLLTSYEDFEYAKRGVKIGVTDYILKNELNADMLKKLLHDAQIEIETVCKNEHLIMEHNIRDFLLNSATEGEDRAYESKPMQTYALLSFYAARPIYVTGEEKTPKKNINCYDIQEINLPEGLRCSAFAEIEDNTYCAIIFVDGTVNNRMRLIYKAADSILSKLNEICSGWKCIQSDEKEHFFQLQAAYHDASEIKDYLYSYENQSIFRKEDIEGELRKEVNTEEYFEDILRALDAGIREVALNKADELIKCCRKNNKAWMYSENMRNLYNLIRRYTVKKRLCIEDMSMAEFYNSPENLERSLYNCMEIYFNDLEQTSSSNYSEHIIEAIDYIRKNYSRDISVTEIAEAINISEGHLRRLFKQELNVSVISYITDYRLERVKSIMSKRDVHLNDIWHETGFSSAQYFSYVFKKKEGMLPRDYIKKLRGIDQ